MLNTRHPEDERLAALAGHDDEAAADRELASHVAACTRCSDVVSELGALRTSLAQLPDLAPPRPLRLLPTVDPARTSTADQLGGWVRRYFAPVVTAGAALALVGAVGTAAPALSDMAGSQWDGSAETVTMQEPDAREADGEAPAATPAAGAASEPAANGDLEDESGDEAANDDALTTLPAERSPWPMVLFTGIALVVGAVGLRWIVAPRPG